MNIPQSSRCFIEMFKRFETGHLGLGGRSSPLISPKGAFLSKETKEDITEGVNQPLEPGFRLLNGLELRSEPEISCRKPAMCASFSDFLPSKMTTSVKCGSGRVR